MRKKTLLVLIIFISFCSLSFSEVSEWSIRIGVKNNEYRDSYNFMGVSQSSSVFYDAKDLPEPPPSPSGLCLYFPHEDWSFRPGRYATDFRPSNMTTETYEFAVESLEGGRLTLFWLDMDKAPKAYVFALVDVESGIAKDMRAVTEYAFDCAAGCKRAFKVLVQRANI